MEIDKVLVLIGAGCLVVILCLTIVSVDVEPDSRAASVIQNVIVYGMMISIAVLVAGILVGTIK